MRWLAATALVMIACVGATQSQIVRLRSKAFIIRLPRVVAKGQALQLDISSDYKHLLLLMADAPADGRFVIPDFGEGRKQSWAGLRNFRLVVFDPFSSDQREIALPPGLQPARLWASGVEGYVIEFEPHFDLAAKTETRSVMCCMGKGSVQWSTLGRNDWLIVDPTVTGYAIQHIGSRSLDVYRPLSPPRTLIEVEPDGDVELRGGHVGIKLWRPEVPFVTPPIPYERDFRWYELFPEHDVHHLLSKGAFETLFAAENPLHSEYWGSLWVYACSCGSDGTSGLVDLIALAEERQVIEQGVLAGFGTSFLGWMVFARGDSVLLRRISEATKQEIELVPKRVSLRADSLWKAEQISRALMRYAIDHDTLPVDEEHILVLIPYLEDPLLLYLLRLKAHGMRLRDVKEPSKTVIGEVEGGFGAAQIFADGHVEWHE